MSDTERIKLLQDAFEKLHEEACNQVDLDCWERIRPICDKVGFDHDALEWRKDE